MPTVSNPTINLLIFSLKNSTMLHFKHTLIFGFAASALLFACVKDEGTSNTNIITRNGIEMKASNEIQTPAVVSPATGNVNVTYNKISKMLNYTISWNNLTSDSVTGSHIHGTASKTQNAAVKHGFTIPASRNGTYSGSVLVDGVTIKEDSLLGGFYYFNIHTNRYKGGEIRGQLEFQ
jgi:hypothetical protein